jgi:hypothetical protein
MDDPTIGRVRLIFFGPIGILFFLFQDVHNKPVTRALLVDRLNKRWKKRKL